MIAFIDDHWAKHGVGPICDVLPIAPATCYDHLAKRADPARLSDRARRDEALRPEIRRVCEDNWSVYGVRKVWHQMRSRGLERRLPAAARTSNETRCATWHGGHGVPEAVDAIPRPKPDRRSSSPSALPAFACVRSRGGDVKILAVPMLFVQVRSLVLFLNLLSVCLLAGVTLLLVLPRVPAAPRSGWMGVWGSARFPMGLSIGPAGLLLSWIALKTGLF